MNKRLLLTIGAVIAAGGVCWLVVRWYNERDVVLAPPSEEQVARDLKRLHPDRPTMPSEPAIEPAMALAPSRPVRLAIGGVGFADEQQNRALADLVTANLTGAKGVDLVDRQSLDKVLRELGMTLSGLVRAKDAIRVGQLLKADWFLLGSSLSVSNSASVVARIVDTRTGIMREVAVFDPSAGIPSLATNLSTFVRQTRQADPKLKSHVFLAIGSFGDIGLNNRQADFPVQLMAYLTKAYQGSPNVTLLEREHVSALLQEVRLDLAGLTEGSTNAPPLQSAFWTVDGLFQSFETTNHQVEVVLQVSRAFGRTWFFTLRGEPEAVNRQVKETIDKTIADAPRIIAPNWHNEIRQQLDTGEELFNVASGNSDPVMMFPPWIDLMGHAGQEPAKRQRNLEEAVRAFQTVLLLDHDNHEAKFYLAACYRDRAMYHLEQARGLLKEVASSAPEDRWCESARVALGRSYEFADDFQAAQHWFEEAARNAKDAGKRAFYQAQADESRGRGIAANASASGTGPADEESRAFFEKRVLGAIEGQLNVLKGKGGGIDDYAGLAGLVEAYSGNKTAAAKAVQDFLPTLKERFPEFMPHLLNGAISYQVDTNTPVLAEFLQSVQSCSKNPDKILRGDHYFDVLLRTPYAWCMDHKLYSVAAELAEAKRDAATISTNLNFDGIDSVKLTFAYLKLQRWADALHVLEPLGDTPIIMSTDGPWGSPIRPFLPLEGVAFCREKLGLPPAQLAGRFDFGKPCLFLPRPAAVAISDTSLWVAIAGELLLLDFNLQTNKQLRLPIEPATPITALCIGPSKIWAGTAGEGLVEYDKASGNFRRLTEQDGLMLNNVNTLCLQDQTLWIGFARGWSGGLGKLDLQTGRVTGFTPPLRANPGTGSSGSDGPPPDAVAMLAFDTAGDLWSLVPGSSLRRYSIAQNSWTMFPAPLLRCIAMNGDKLVAGFSRPQTKIKMASEPAPGQTNSPGIVEQLVTDEEFNRIQREPKLRERYLGSVGASSMLPQRGDVSWRPLGEDQWRPLVDGVDLPDRTDCLALDGSDVWVGGPTYVAVLDLNQKKIRTLCRTAALSVDRLEVAGGYLWAKFDWRLYRVPLSATR